MLFRLNFFQIIALTYLSFMITVYQPHFIHSRTAYFAFPKNSVFLEYLELFSQFLIKTAYICQFQSFFH